MHFHQILGQTKWKSAKCRIRWSKVPRVLGPLKLSYGQFSGRLGNVFKPKNTQNGNKLRFSGLRAFSAKFAGDKIEESEIPHRMLKSAARFGPRKIELLVSTVHHYTAPFQITLSPSDAPETQPFQRIRCAVGNCRVLRVTRNFLATNVGTLIALSKKKSLPCLSWGT